MTTEAKIILAAADQTGAAFASVSRNFTDLQRSTAAVESGLRSLIGLVGTGALVAFAKNAISSAAALDDMAEATGASVEGLSRIQQVASKTGQDFGQVEGALVKLTKTLSPFSGDSKAAAAALNAIGLSIDELRAMAPDQAFEKFARSLNEFEDGAGKTQVVLAMLGKTGAQYLPLLKEMAEDQETLGRITADQAAAAEQLEKEWGKLATTAENFANAISLKLVPALNQMATAMRAGGFGGGLAASVTAMFSDNLGQNIEVLRKKLEDIEQKRARNSIYSGGIAGGLLGIEESQIINTIEALKALQREQALALGQGAYSHEGRGVADTPAKKQIDAIAAAAENAEKKVKSAKVAKDTYLSDVFGASEDDLQRLFAKREEQLDETGFAGSKSYMRFVKENMAWERQAWAELARDREDQERDVARAAKQAADDARRDWQRSSDLISESLTDALMRGFEGGKDWADNFFDNLKNLFGSLVLRPIIQPIAQPVAGGVLGMLGMGSASASGGGLGGNAAGLLGNLGSAVSGGAGMAYLGSMIGGEFGAGLAFGSTGIAGAAAGAGAMAAAGSAAGTAGAAMGVIGAAAPYVALALAAASALGLFGDEGPAQRTSRYMADLGQDWPHAYQNNQWFSSSMHGEMNAFTAQRAAQEQALIANMGLTPEQIARVNAALQGTAGKTYGFGTEFGPIPQETFAQIEQDRLAAIAQALGKSLEELTSEIDGTAKGLRDAGLGEAVKQLHEQLAKAMADAKARMLDWAQAARGVIDTRIGIAGGDLSALDPQEKLSLASKAFTDVSRRAALGDLSAFQGLGSAATDYLGAARAYYASGSGYASVYEEVQAALERAQNLAVRQVNLSGSFNELLIETQTGNAANEAGIEAMIKQLVQIKQVLLELAGESALAGSIASNTAPSAYPAWQPSSSPGSLPRALRVFSLIR